ncbi:MAG: hypothetical protein ACRDOA_23665, partial [Streptosporangiaceae bacterium]
MSVLITNIAELITNGLERDAAPHSAATGPQRFAAMAGAALVIEQGRVAWTGPASRAPAADEMVDAGGRAVL